MSLRIVKFGSCDDALDMGFFLLVLLRSFRVSDDGISGRGQRAGQGRKGQVNWRQPLSIIESRKATKTKEGETKC